jgi:uncharacterized membrane protein YhhN
MTASVWAWLAAAGMLAVLDWLTVARRARQWERFAKPAVLGCLLVAAALARPSHPHVHGWTIAALAFGLLGDLALVLQDEPATERAGVLVTANSPGGRSNTQPAAEPRPLPADPRSQRLFLAGLLSFLIGHLCYLVAMLRFGTDRLSVGFGLILVLIALFAFGYKIIAGAYASGGALLTAGIAGYMVALGSAVVLGVGTTRLTIAYGIVLFAVSDLVLASDRFVQPRPWSPLAVIITYHLAQALLVIGLLR